jgi:hypothetical protein
MQVVDISRSAPDRQKHRYRQTKRHPGVIADGDMSKLLGEKPASDDGASRANVPRSPATRSGLTASPNKLTTATTVGNGRDDHPERRPRRRQTYLFGALLAPYPSRQPNHRSDTWVLSEGLVGVVVDLLQVTVGALHVTSKAAQIPLRTFAPRAPQATAKGATSTSTSPADAATAGPPHRRSMTPGDRASPVLRTARHTDCRPWALIATGPGLGAAPSSTPGPPTARIL